MCCDGRQQRNNSRQSKWTNYLPHRHTVNTKEASRNETSFQFYHFIFQNLQQNSIRKPIISWNKRQDVNAHISVPFEHKYKDLLTVYSKIIYSFDKYIWRLWFRLVVLPRWNVPYNTRGEMES